MDLQNIGLCCGSLMQANFRQLAEAAAKAGFSSISMWPNVFQDALESGLSVNDLRRILDDNGLVISELDPLCSWLPLSIPDGDMASNFYSYSADDFFQIADCIGGKTLNVIQLAETSISDNERSDLLARLCERATKHSLQVSFEFLPWSPVKNIDEARALVKSTGAGNCGINLDTWHYLRSGGTIEQLAAMDGSLVNAIQFNDVAAEPWDDMINETSTGRLLPGEGAGNSVGLLEAMVKSGIDATINVEVFSTKLMEMDANEAAQLLYQSMRKVIRPLFSEQSLAE